MKNKLSKKVNEIQKNKEDLIELDDLSKHSSKFEKSTTLPNETKMTRLDFIDPFDIDEDMYDDDEDSDKVKTPNNLGVQPRTTSLLTARNAYDIDVDDAIKDMMQENKELELQEKRRSSLFINTHKTSKTKKNVRFDDRTDENTFEVKSPSWYPPRVENFRNKLKNINLETPKNKLGDIKEELSFSYESPSARLSPEMCDQAQDTSVKSPSRKDIHYHYVSNYFEGDKFSVGKDIKPTFKGMNASKNVITSLKEFLQWFGWTTAGEFGELIHILHLTTGTMFKVAKSVFTQAEESNIYENGPKRVKTMIEKRKLYQKFPRFSGATAKDSTKMTITVNKAQSNESFDKTPLGKIEPRFFQRNVCFFV